MFYLALGSFSNCCYLSVEDDMFSLSDVMILMTSPLLQVDPFHTLFGVAGLSLLGDERIKSVNPVLCMPEDVLQRIDLQPQLLS